MKWLLIKYVLWRRGIKGNRYVPFKTTTMATTLSLRHCNVQDFIVEICWRGEEYENVISN